MDFGIARSTSLRHLTRGQKRTRLVGSPSSVGRRRCFGRTMEGAIIGTVSTWRPSRPRASPSTRASTLRAGTDLYDMLGGLAGCRHGQRDQRAHRAHAGGAALHQYINPEFPRRSKRLSRAALSPTRIPATRRRKSSRRTCTGSTTRATCFRCCGGSAAASWRVRRSLPGAAGRHVVGGAGPAPVVELPPTSVLISDFDNRAGETIFEGSRRADARDRAGRCVVHHRLSAPRRRSRLRRRSAGERASTRRWRDYLAS